jgi:hypothetical protein
VHSDEVSTPGEVTLLYVWKESEVPGTKHYLFKVAAVLEIGGANMIDVPVAGALCYENSAM